MTGARAIRERPSDDWRIADSETRIPIKAGRRTIAYVQMGPHDIDVANLIVAAPRAIAVLKALEWSADVDDERGGFVEGCPSCDATKRSGQHFLHCELAGAIALAKGEI